METLNFLEETVAITVHPIDQVQINFDVILEVVNISSGIIISSTLSVFHLQQVSSVLY